MTRDNFGSRFGVLMAVIGSAVGLGNLWKFPYVAGKNGGAAFIILYLGFMVLLCIPLMLSEFVIGRRSQANVVGSFRKLAPGTPWYFTGVIGVAAAFFILSFYGVVGGWTLEYIISSAGIGLNSELIDSEQQFHSFTQSTVRPIIFLVIFMGLTTYIVLAGIKNGIERYSKILMPLLFLMIVILAIRSLTLSGASAGIEFLLNPDFSAIDGNVILDALGQGLFSLSLGMGCMITYSSYFKKNINLSKVTLITISADTLFALIAGIAILPAVFALGFQPDAGPGLVFIILPKVFELMPGGSVFAIIFFIVLAVAALTSAISLLEVVVAYLSEELKLKRKTATWIAAVTISIAGVFCSLSLGSLAGIKIFDNTIFDFFDKFSSNFLMPFGGMLIVLFVGWKMRRADVYDELLNGGTLKIKMFNTLMFLLKFFAPIAIALIFLNKIGLLNFM
ncbi:MAG: sodium-dependent transporter [Prevotellaceae bacterium]|jgi:NSS family neurotransmitter:Na+ symporter|nr:sodium-dependent transporter [Prevotellaceae bacterium]